MRSADIAFLMAMIDLDPGKYPRKKQVLQELQRKYGAIRSAKTKVVSIRVSTQWAEARAAERAAAADEKGRKH